MAAQSVELELLESGADHSTVDLVETDAKVIGAVRVQALFDGRCVAQITSYNVRVAMDLDLLSIPHPLVDRQMSLSCRNDGQLLATRC